MQPLCGIAGAHSEGRACTSDTQERWRPRCSVSISPYTPVCGLTGPSTFCSMDALARLYNEVQRPLEEAREESLSNSGSNPMASLFGMCIYACT